jgi:hypothetical protein
MMTGDRSISRTSKAWAIASGYAAVRAVTTSRQIRVNSLTNII